MAASDHIVQLCISVNTVYTCALIFRLLPVLQNYCVRPCQYRKVSIKVTLIIPWENWIGRAIYFFVYELLQNLLKTGSV